MATKLGTNQVGLGQFVELAGRSIADAQDAIGPLEQPTQMVIGNAEVEVKVTVASDDDGALAVQTISSTEAGRGDIDPGLLSTLRVNFVAAAAEAATTSLGAARPKRNASDVIKEISRREDVVNVTKALGKLDYEATYVPNQKRWLVIARDAKLRTVRETVVPDIVGEKGVG